MKPVLFVLPLLLLFACGTNRYNAPQHTQSNRTEYFPKAFDVVEEAPVKEKLWVFLMAGQSNMAGRGLVEPQDTVSSERILTINRNGQVILAKEPLHFYEPMRTGLDCGLSFGKTLIDQIPDSISILLLPTAIGGSSVSQWLGDSLYRNVRLLSNFRDKVETGKTLGQIKGILWHQGESDANPTDSPFYSQRLSELFKTFRTITGNEALPILIGELGSFSKNAQQWQAINQSVKEYSATDNHTAIISTAGLKHKGDSIHFDSEGQRIMGQRFAKAYVEKFK
jgi:hypothetical protein